MRLLDKSRGHIGDGVPPFQVSHGDNLERHAPVGTRKEFATLEADPALGHATTLTHHEWFTGEALRRREPIQLGVAQAYTAELA